MRGGQDSSLHLEESKISQDNNRSRQQSESLLSALPLTMTPDMAKIENAFVMSLRAKNVMKRLKEGKEIAPTNPNVNSSMRLPETRSKSVARIYSNKIHVINEDEDHGEIKNGKTVNFLDLDGEDSDIVHPPPMPLEGGPLSDS